MTRTTNLFLQAATVALAMTMMTGPAPAQSRRLIDCALDVNAARPECQGRGKTTLKQRGDVSDVTPRARTNTRPMGAPAVTGGTGRVLIDCALGVNAARPECQGRGKTTLKRRGDPSDVTPRAR